MTDTKRIAVAYDVTGSVAERLVISGSGGSNSIMALGEQIKLVTLQRRGPATCINISNKLRAQLGWNKGEALRLDVIEGSLVVTRVILPPAAQVIQTATRRDVAAEVQPVSDNKQDV